MGLRVLATTLVLLFAGGALAGEVAETMTRKTRFDGMQIRATHPRIWLDEARLAWLKKKVEGKSVDEVKALTGTSTEGLALLYVITGDRESGRAAVEQVKASRGRRLSTTMGIVYDWCYPLLSDEEKVVIRERLVAGCKDAMNNKRAWRSFHNSLYNAAWPATAAAIAISGDDPYGNEMLDFLKGELEDVLRTFDNVFPDGSWGEGFDYNWHVSLEALRIFWAIKTASGLDVMAASPHLRNTGLFIMYSQKSDGLVLPIDDNDWPFLGGWEHEGMLLAAAEYGDPYCQYFLNHCRVERFAFEGRDLWKTLLWYDPRLPEQPLTDLPQSRIFRGMGLVLARSGWDWDGADRMAGDTWVSFRCGPYFGDHAHYDNNTFEIYHKGELAIESGRYDDDWGMEQEPGEIGKSQFFNYYQRTIAHNSIVVYDPEEKFELGVVNDGGQLELLRVNGVRNVPEDYDQGNFPSEGGAGKCDWATNPGRWDTGKVVAYKATDDFTYVCGDATKSYSPAKLASFVRHFVFIQPDLFVVFDRVVSKNGDFKKTWLLHTVEEPAIAADGKSFEAANKEGRLVCVPVLPGKRTITKVGGPGNEFLVGGVHYACGPNASSGRLAELHYGETPGAWRIEESPAEPAKEDYFLNVMLVTDRGSSAVPAVEAVTPDENHVGVRVTAADGTAATLVFARGDKPGATMKLVRDGKVVFDGALPEGVVLEDGRPK